MSDADPAILQRVSAILERVRNEGDEALFDYTKQFDQVEISELKVSEEEMAEALAKVDDSLLKDLQEAAENITAYHKLQLQEGYELKKKRVFISDSASCRWHVWVIYVPGGRAAYPSTVLMNVLPAKIAGVKDIVMVTPPDKEGRIAPVIAGCRKGCGSQGDI